jgi:competence/damage-inducible protein CinA-like protein
MPTAEIITIGTELLLGEITDTNSTYLARALRDIGVDLYRKTTIGDNAARIAQVIQETLGRSDIVITTGGLGPTVDDPTRDAVALAVGRKTVFKQELWEQIQRRFERFGRKPTENNRRQAYIPEGAIPVENQVGTAPSFIVETADGKAVISLPGVPREMEHLMHEAVIPYLRSHYNLRGVILARVLHTSGMGESVIDEMIGDLETLPNPTVGLSAHAGQVDVRITAKADTHEQAQAMIDRVEQETRQRLGKAIYGADAETLEQIAATNLQRHGWRLAAIEFGLSGQLLRRLSTMPIGYFSGGQILPKSPENRAEAVEAARQAGQAELGMGVFLYPTGDKQEIYITIITPGGRQEQARPYGGPPGNAPQWAINHSLDILRNL